MNWLTKTFASSIGRKLTMGLTGLFLCSFLLVHLSINLLMLLHDGGDTFNVWAEFMATNPLIRAMEVVLLFAVILLVMFFDSRYQPRPATSQSIKQSLQAQEPTQLPQAVQ
jgi:hypothetical protein